MAVPTTHFASEAYRLSRKLMLGATPLITVTALAGVPGFLAHAYGERVVRRANEAARLDVEAIEDPNCFIPHLTMATYLDAIERLVGDEDFSLVAAPHLTMGSKGCWADYMLGGATLHEAIARGISTIAFHSKGDVLSLAMSDGEARVSYASAAKTLDGYRHIAVGSAAILLSLCRAFLPPPWQPSRIEFDLAVPVHPGAFEEVFGCPVRFEAETVSVCFEARDLYRRAVRPDAHALITAGDVARARVDCRTLNALSDVVIQQIWAQVLSGSVSVESAACSVGTSVRTLQRELNREGTSFRDLANAMRTKRAMELLRETDASVTEIAAALGYSAPAHFARAFRAAAGISPNGFRRPRQSPIAG